MSRVICSLFAIFCWDRTLFFFQVFLCFWVVILCVGCCAGNLHFLPDLGDQQFFRLFDPFSQCFLRSYIPLSPFPPTFYEIRHCFLRLQVVWHPNISISSPICHLIWDRRSLFFWRSDIPFSPFPPIFYKSDKVFRVFVASAIRTLWLHVDSPARFQIGHPWNFEIGHSIFFFFPKLFLTSDKVLRIFRSSRSRISRFYEPIPLRSEIGQVRSHKRWKKEGEKEPRSKITPQKRTASVEPWSNSCGVWR